MNSERPNLSPKQRALIFSVTAIAAAILIGIFSYTGIVSRSGLAGAILTAVVALAILYRELIWKRRTKTRES